MGAREQVDNFYRFATERLRNSSSELSVDELYDQWRIENPSSAQQADDLAAIYVSLEDFKQGERGRPDGETTQRLREEFGIRSPE